LAYKPGEVVEMSDANEAATQARFGILQAELTRLRDSVMEGWRSYHTWSTWFFGLQVAGLGWIFLSPAQKLASAPYMNVLAGAAIMLNLLGILGALRVRLFAVLQMKRANAICRTMMQHTDAAGLQVEITSGFPGELFRLGGGITAAAFSITVVAWSCVFFF
jgi:hypothetical protein